MSRQKTLELMVRRPAEVGRLCGFPRLSDWLHGSWLRQMLLGRDDLTLLAHRGSCKTTCLCIAIAELMLLQPDAHILFLRKTDADVAEVLRQVQRLLRGGILQELSARLYGSPVRISRATVNELSLDCQQTARGAVQLLGQGIGGSLTGKHADLIFTDDIVNLEDRLSAAERARTRAVYQELQNIRNPGGRIINTGTPWHREDAIALMPNVQRYDCYTTGLLSRQQLDELRQRMSPALFAANYELRHIAEEGALFTRPPAFVAEERLLWDGIAHLDAAYGGGDCTALTCASRRGGQLILYGRLWPGHVDDALPELLAECSRLRCAPLWLESNADKGYLARELRRRHVCVRVYSERMNKHIKISACLRRCWPNVRFLAGTDPAYLAQIMEYGCGAAHDDAPDSAACAVRILERQARDPREGDTLLI